jgi:ankyrin repeat protein
VQLSLALKQSEDDAMLHNVHKRNASGETALHVCAIKGNTRMVRLLIQHVRGRGFFVDVCDGSPRISCRAPTSIRPTTPGLAPTFLLFLFHVLVTP